MNLFHESVTLVIDYIYNSSDKMTYIQSASECAHCYTGIQKYYLYIEELITEVF